MLPLLLLLGLFGQAAISALGNQNRTSGLDSFGQSQTKFSLPASLPVDDGSMRPCSRFDENYARPNSEGALGPLAPNRLAGLAHVVMAGATDTDSALRREGGRLRHCTLDSKFRHVFRRRDVRRWKEENCHPVREIEYRKPQETLPPPPAAAGRCRPRTGNGRTDNAAASRAPHGPTQPPRRTPPNGPIPMGGRWSRRLRCCFWPRPRGADEARGPGDAPVPAAAGRRGRRR